MTVRRTTERGTRARRTSTRPARRRTVRRTTPFRSRNPIVVGAVAIVTLTLVVLAALDAEDLPLIGQGPTYTARFSEAAGLRVDDDVRVAGVHVGHVTRLGLDRGDVVVSFKAPDAWIGDRTRASIEIKTVLGHKYLALQPDGVRPLDPADAIPRTRTTAPYDVVEAFSDLSATVSHIDTGALGQSLGVLAQTLDGSAPSARPALDGLSRLSRTIASRDQDLDHLLANTRATSGVLADRDAQVSRLLQDGNQLLGELRGRKQAIDDLLTGTRALSVQLSGLVADNQATLGPALTEIDGVLSVLQANSINLDNGLRLLAPFARQFGNTLGSGRWFDAYVCNLDPPGDRNCAPGGTGSASALGRLAPTPSTVTRAVDRLGQPLLGQADRILTPAQLRQAFPGGVPLLSPATLGGR